MRGVLLVCVVGCGYPRLAPLDMDAAAAAAGVMETRRFDLADLAAGQAQDMTVDTVRGALTPNAYTYGGLVAHGLNGVNLWTPADSSWAKLAGRVPSGVGLWCGEQLKNPAGQAFRFDYLGIDDPTATIWLEGEVWLDGAAGETFRVNADAFGFVDLAPPGSTAYTRVAANGTGAVVQSGAGWYPVRVGFSNGDAIFNFEFRHTDPGGSEVAWTRDRMRARTSELPGVLRTVFDLEILGGGMDLAGTTAVAPPVRKFEQARLLDATSFAVNPEGADNDNDWSARYAGQVFIKTPGMYTLTIDSRDGSRGRLGSVRGEFNWSRGANSSNGDPKTLAQATLDAGWNDLTVDYNQDSGSKLLHVTLQGPDFPTAIEVPAASLRPVEPADDRLALGVLDPSAAIPNDGGPDSAAVATLSVVGYAGEVVDSIELSYELTAQHWDQLTVDLERPGLATRIVLRDRVDLPGEGTQWVQLAIPNVVAPALGDLLGGPAAGDWKLRVYDNAGGTSNAGASLNHARLTLHTRGGPDKIARAATWTSPVIDATTAAFEVDGVRWTERVPDGASIAVRVGTCQQASCSDALWTDPVTQGMPIAIPRARYLQLRVDMTSNGRREPELSAPQVAFRRDPG